MAAEDVKGKKRKGAQDSAPKAKKPRKSDDIVAAPKPSKAVKAVSAPTGSKAAKTRATRKTAADFFSDDETPAEPVKDVAKAVKGKQKSKTAVATNGDAPEPMDIAVEAKAQEKPKKAGKKGKAVVEETLVVEAPVVVEAPKEKATKAKKGKKADPTPVEEDEAPVKKSKKAKGSKKQPEPVEEVTEVEVVSEEAEGEIEEDDQTAALLAGFESDEDDEAKDPEEDDEFDANAPKPKMTKQDQTALEKALKNTKSNEPGVIYIGRVPRGFFEAEMKRYFSQFGRVNRLRLSRNKKTGASKHYAFVEFQSSEVADIVARTMNNYLLFGHILKVNTIPAEQVHPDLFKGAGERFKIDPRNKKAGLQMERGVDRAQWAKRVEKETKRRQGRSKALLEEYGYEYDPPAVKSVDSVPKQLENDDGQQQIAEDIPEQPKANKGKKAKAIAEAQPTETAPVEEAPAVEQPKPKKAKKAAKSKVEVEADMQAEIAAEVAAPTPEKKTKKDKKRKSDVVAPETTTTTTTTTTTIVETPAADLTPRSKRAKKQEPVPVVEETVVEKKVTKPKKAKKAKA